MQKKYTNKLIILIAFIFTLNNAFSKKVEGYIVTNTADTVYGEIRVSRFNMSSSGIVLFGINLEPFFSTVRFRQKGESQFRTYSFDEVSHFSFTYKSTEYKFDKFEITTRSLVKSEEMRTAFLNLIYSGEVKLYQEIRRAQSTNLSTNGKSIAYSNYYLYSTKQNLCKVEQTKAYEKLADLLSVFEIDPKFIQLLPYETKFKDINAVLLSYDTWKETFL